MAYAFDKVSDYFRRQKTGQRGDLQRGTTGAPPPTAAAESLAKQAETSAEIGSSDTSAYRANMAGNQTGATQALKQPAEKQASQWAATQEAKAGEYKGGEQKRIEQQYQGYDAGDIAKAESGDQGAISKLGQQRQYTGTEMTWQPYQVEAPQLDTTSMMRGGVGGLQAALQKQKGGRYTAGMGALDASLLSGNKAAMQGLQSQLGGIYQGAREKQAQLEQTDEQLAEAAKTRASGVASTVKSELQKRLDALNIANQGRLETRAKELSEANKRQFMPSFGMEGGSAPVEDAIRAALIGQGLNEYDANAAISQMGYINPSEMLTTTGSQTYTESPTDYANIAAALGVAPKQFSADYATWGIDKGLVDSRAYQAARAYRDTLARQRAAAAPQQVWVSDTFTDPETGQTREGGGHWEAAGAESDQGAGGYSESSESVDMNDARSGYQEFQAPGYYQDYGTMDYGENGTFGEAAYGEGEQDGGW